MKKLSVTLVASLILMINSGKLSSIDIDEKHAKEYSKLRFENNKIHEWNTNYQKTLNFIKKHEGFNNGATYIDLGGYATVGYGHVVLANETFSDTITEFQADSILKRDFQKAIRGVERLTDLEGNKKLAIAHFIYAKGIGAFSRSTLLKKIKAEEEVDSEILRWCHYKNRRGKLIRSEYSYKTRQWELALYKS